MTQSPKRSRVTRKRLVVAGVISTVVIVVSGVAFAAWLSTGTGSGGAASGSAVVLTVTAASGTADLFPGTIDGDVFFTVANTNSYPVTFTTMTAGAVTSSDQTNCASSNVTVANAAGLTLIVPAHATATALSIPDVVTMLPGAPNGCQAQTFTIALTLTGASSAT